MKSLLLVLLILASGSLVFGQAESVPSEKSSSRESRLTEFLKLIDTNHDGELDAEEIQAAGPRTSMIEGLIRRAGLEPKYPIKISDIQTGIQNARTNRGHAVAESPNESPKFKTLKEILEALPRKPETGDNKLASKVANKWLQSNVIGSVIQFSGMLSHIGQTSSRDGFLISLSLESKQDVWEGYNFNLSVHAMAPPKADINNYSKISHGDIVTVEGMISGLEMEWESGKGSINLSLADCKLLSFLPANASDQVDERIRKFALAVLKQNDKDGSGVLEKDKGEWSLVRHAESIDKDHNGIITLDELTAYYQTRDTLNTKPANLFEATEAPKQPSITSNTGTITITGDSVHKPSKFWTGTTDTGVFAVRLDEIHFIQLIEVKSNNPPTWLIYILLKTKNDPIPVSFKEAEKAHAAYQSLLQALESGSEKVVEGIGKNPAG
jgi:hypothetical protein